MAAESAAGKKGKAKKKGQKFAPLPGVQASQKLPFQIAYNHRFARHAVTTADIAEGTLVFVEQPFLRLPQSKFAAAVCTRCLRTLHPGGEVPANVGNPCLPRYCPACKENPNPLDAKLASLRIKLHEVAKSHNIDPFMFNILTVLDLQRSGLDVGAPPPADFPERAGKEFDDVRCSPADFDSMTNYWDRKSENWRKTWAPLLRALHKELTAFAQTGVIPEYKPSSIGRLQADAAQLGPNAQQVAGPQAVTETGLALFPGLSLFPHACVPNCHMMVLQGRAFVRTLVDVPAGSPLTLAYVSVTEPRIARQHALAVERFFTCGCTRCSEPLRKGTDRLLEGIICPMCQVDVMLALDEGAENDEARASWKNQVMKLKAAEAARLARMKRGGKKSGGNSSKNNSNSSKEGEEKKDPSSSSTTITTTDKEKEQRVPQTEEELEESLKNVMFWKCCSDDCASVYPAHMVDQISGPADALQVATRYLQQGMTLLSVNNPEMKAQGEHLLEMVANGLEGRLPIYHHLVTSAERPLASMSLRKGEGSKAFNYAYQLWLVDKELNESRPSMNQFECLELMADAAEARVVAGSSDMLKRNMEKKVKAAREEQKKIRPVLMGGASTT